MKLYRYLCIDHKEQRCKGTLKAVSSAAAQRELVARGWVLLSLDEEEFAPAITGLVSRPKPLSAQLRNRFFLQFSVLFGSGIPIVRALELAAGRETEEQHWIDPVLASIEQGQSLSSALDQQQLGFEASTIALLKLGEESGQLVDVLERLADRGTESMDRRAELKAKLTYPLVQFIVLVFLCLLLATFMGPRLSDMVSGLGGQQPLLTLWVLRVLSFPVMATLGALALGITVLAFLSWSTPAGKEMRELIAESLPIAGEIRQQLLLASFCQSLAPLIDYGFGWDQSLKMCLSGSEKFDQGIEKFRQELLNSDLTEAVARTDEFPAMMKSFLLSGLESSKVPELLKLYAEILEDRCRHKIEALLALLEPTILISLGSMVGIVVIAAFLPILSLVSDLGN